MPQGIGGELYHICPTLEKSRINTLFVSDLAAGGAYSLLNMETSDWVSDTTSNGLRALEFGGSNEYISGPTASNIESVGAVTLAFWAHRTATSHRQTFGKVNGNTRLAIQVWDDGNLYFFAGNTVYGSIAHSATGWNHYALVFDGSQATPNNRIRGYVNGVLQTLSYTGTPATTTPAAGIGPLLIGQSGAAFPTGRFDDARVFGTALDATAISLLFSARGIQAADTILDPITIRFRSTPAMANPWLFPEGDRVSIVDWYRYRVLATESLSDPGLYTATVDASFGNYRVYNTSGRGSTANIQTERITVERSPNLRAIKTRETSKEWTPEMLTAGAYWFDPKPGYVFTDAAGTALAKVGDSVLSMRCRSTGTLIVASGAMTLRRDFWGGYYLDTNGQHFTVGALTGLSNSQCFMSVAFRLTSGSSARALIGTQSGGGTAWYLAANGPTQFTGWASSPSGSFTASYTNSTYANSSFRNNVWSALYDAGQASVFAGQYRVDATGETGTAGFFTEPLFFFKYAANAATDGDFAGAVLVRGATTQEERVRLINYLADQNKSLFINAAGNSLTAGTGSTGNANGYPVQALTSLNARYGSANYSLVNSGNPGQDDLVIFNDWTGLTEPAGSYNNISAMCGTSPRILAIWGITNSIGAATYTARQAVDYLWDLCRVAKRYGFKTILFSCIDRNQTTTHPAFPALMRQANQLLDEEWREFADIYFPLHQLPQFRTANNSTFYNVDLVHLNDTGYGVIADLFVKGVNYILEGLPEQVADVKPTLKEIEGSAILASGGGQYAVTVTVRQNGTSNPIQGALVTALSGGVAVGWAYANASGVAVLALNAGAFTLNATATGFTAITGQALTVDGAEAVSINMVPASIGPPVDPGLCTVRFVVLTGAGAAAGAGYKVEVALQQGSNHTLDSSIASRVMYQGTTNASGIADLVFIRRDAFTRGGVYSIKIRSPQGEKIYDNEAYCPNESFAFSSDLIDA